MERIKICDVKKRNGEAVKVQGFVENIRIKNDDFCGNERPYRQAPDHG